MSYKFSIKPPTAKQQSKLQQLILFGLPENIARKKMILNEQGVDLNLQSKRPQYETLLNNEPCLLHAESNVNNPEYL